MGEGKRSQKMGLLGAISYIIGNIVGSGLFITPTSILKDVNTVGVSLIIWILAALISMLGSFCYVEMGTSIRMSGADYAYMCFMKWYPIAFAFACIGCTINYPATLAVQAQTFSEYVFKAAKIEMDDDSEFWAKKFLGFALIWCLLFLNYFSLKTFVQRFQIVSSLAKIAATALVIGIGFYYLIFKGDTDNLKKPFENRSGNTESLNAGTFVQALFAGLYSYDGWDILNYGVEEIENPRRTMPIAIIIGMIGIALIYLAVNLSFFIVLDVPSLEQSPAVAMTFADETMGKASFVMAIFVALLLVGSLNSTMFSASRYLQAVSKHRQLPSAVSSLNPIVDSPRVALTLHVLIAFVVSFMGDPNNLINYIGFAQWSQRAVTMAALVWIRFRKWPLHPDKIRVPIVMPIIFCLVCTAMVVITIIEDIKSAGVGLGIWAGGFVIWCIFLWGRSLNSLPSYRNFSKNINETTTRFAQIIFDVMPDIQVGDERLEAIGGLLEKEKGEEDGGHDNDSFCSSTKL